MPLEIEAKFLVENFAPAREALARAGYTCTKPRTLMKRKTFTLKEKAGATIHEWARVRDEGDKVTMTYKHTHTANSAMGTEEVEAEVSSFETASLFMEKLGFRDFLYQENYREAWDKDGVQVTLDEWPVIGCIIEIEAPSEDLVKATARQLGFDYTAAVFGGVGALYYHKYGKDMGLVHELTFANVADVQRFLATNTIN